MFETGRGPLPGGPSTLPGVEGGVDGVLSTWIASSVEERTSRSIRRSTPDGISPFSIRGCFRRGVCRQGSSSPGVRVLEGAPFWTVPTGSRVR